MGDVVALQSENSAEPKRDDLQIFDSVQVAQRRYCWTPYIPARCVTLLQGDPQTGKSTVVRAIAAALSNGAPLPPDDERREPMRVLYQNAEDDFSSVIVPHLKVLGANMGNFARVNEDHAPLFFYYERIEEHIERFKPQLVVCDTLQRYAGGKVNLNDLTAVTALFDYLTDIAKRFDCAIVVVSHLNKQDTKAEYKGFGSVGIRASVRSTLTSGKIGEGTGRFGLFHSKSNGIRPGAPLEFEIFGDAEVRWLGNKVVFELLDTIEFEASKYALLTPYYETEEEYDLDNPADVFVMREVVSDENDEPMLETVEDEKLLQTVYSLFKQGHDGDFSFRDS